VKKEVLESRIAFNKPKSLIFYMRTKEPAFSSKAAEDYCARLSIVSSEILSSPPLLCLKEI